MRNSWIFLEQVLRVASNLFVFAIIVRHYGAIEIGEYAYTISVVSILVVFAKFGTEQIILKDFSDESQQINQTFSFAILQLAMFSIVVFFLSLAAFSFFVNLSELMLLALILILIQPVIVSTLYFQAQSKLHLISMLNVIVIIMTSVFKIICVFYNLGIEMIVVSYLFEQSLTGLFLLIYLVSASRVKIDFRFKLREFQCLSKSLLIKSLPLLISSLSIIIYMRTDQIMIGLLHDSSEVGLYAVAIKIYEATLIFPVIITTYFAPKIYKKKNSGGCYHEMLSQIFLIVMLYNALVVIFVVLLGERVITTFFGNDFLLSFSILIVLTISGVFASIGIARGPWVIVEGIQKLSMYYIVVGALSNVILNYIFIPSFGALGAAYASAISQFIVAFVSPCVFRKTRLFYILFLSSFSFKSLRGVLDAYKVK